MKKMLVLALVLAVAGIANAGLTGLKVDGANIASGYNGVGTTLEILMSYTSGTPISVVFASNKAVVLNVTAPAALDASAEVLPSIFIDDDEDPQTPMIPVVAGVLEGFDGPIWGFDTFSTGTVNVASTVFATITAGQKPVTIQIYNIVDGAGTLAGEVTLVPEPMTMALLGLGGLFLRKRK